MRTMEPRRLALKTAEFRVRPVTRYVVTRYEQEGNAGSCETCGEFDNNVLASKAMFALSEAETVFAQPPDIVVTRRPVRGGEEVRTWKVGVGWDEQPARPSSP